MEIISEKVNAKSHSLKSKFFIKDVESEVGIFIYNTFEKLTKAKCIKAMLYYCNKYEPFFATLYYREKGTKYKIYDHGRIDLFINTIQKYFPEIYYKTKPYTKIVQVRNSFFTQYETRIFCELDIDNKYWQRKDYKDKLIGLLRLEGILKVKES